MDDRRDQLRTELRALLAAGGELPENAHSALVENFLTKLELQEGASNRRGLIRAVSREFAPVSLPTVIGVALAHGAPLFIIGKIVLEGELYIAPDRWEYMPLWLMIGVIWLIGVAITIASVSLITQRHNLQRQPSRSRKVLRA